MRRKVVFGCGFGVFFISLFSFYVMLKQLDTQEGQEILSRSSMEIYANLNSKLAKMEHELKENKLAMDKLRSGLSDLVKLSKVANAKIPNREAVIETILQKDKNGGNTILHFPKSEFNFTKVQNMQCQTLRYELGTCDVAMTNLYDVIDWRDVDGGVWKQGYKIETNDEEWKGRKLKVFVVPHSHNDPGWLKTYEDYFNAQTRHILDNVVDNLSLDKKRRFIWAEISYLSMWYNIADETRREKLRNLISNGQFEIVTGGWVMNDEANTHYFAMIDQMIEGHEWARRTFNVIPKSGWAIDPFGHTPTMAYLLKRMGLENMLIQRVHYSVKKDLSMKKALEFRWRQQWDGSSTTDITCHMMPFYSYDVPHTCGPDPKICCQFDFGRLPGMRRTCPWGVPPRAINDGNVEERAKTLLDQYRKKSKLFKTDTLLVILGDDFRYDKMVEIEAQFSNYGRLFDYINSHPELNAEAQFGTLSEYFDAMQNDAGGPDKLPSLTGDFFTYSDREDHYWSGYYTSRPFYKTQERNLESNLRAAEILLSLALPTARRAGVEETLSKKLYPLLVESRQYLGLFQHHDGITGTSKDPVVIDYGKKLQKSIMNAKQIISKSSEVLLAKDPASVTADEIIIDYDAIMASHDKVEEKVVVKLEEVSGSSVSLVIYNSLAHDRTGLVRVLVTTPRIQVNNARGEIIPSQVNLIWIGPTEARRDQFELVFVASASATGLATYKLSYQSTSPQNTLSKIDLINTPEGASLPIVDQFFIGTKHSVTDEFTLDNDQLTASFSSHNGLLKSITTKRDNVKTGVSVDFATYESRRSKDKSGAYLFLPSGPSSPHMRDSDRPLVRIIDGPLLKEVQVLVPNVQHTVSLHLTNNLGPAPLAVFLTNRVDIRSGFDNRELSMRITSPEAAGSDNLFYTDLNGFQMQQRRTKLDKLPLQANFYPMPSMAFTQSSKTRLTVLTGQPRGVASLVPGQIEIVMDRRLMQDDNRGVGQGVKDNVVTCDSYAILVERWKTTPQNLNSPNHYPSIVTHHTLLDILHPMRAMRFKDLSSDEVARKFKDNFRPLSSPGNGERGIPCSFHLVNLRNIESHDRHGFPSDQSALILQNFGHECRLDSCSVYKSSCNAESATSVALSRLYPVSSVQSTSLSLQYLENELAQDSVLTLEPMEIKAYKVKLD